MVQLVERSSGLIHKDGANKRRIGPELTALRPNALRDHWQAFIAGPRLPRRTAWAIIQFVSLLFWVGLIAAIYFAWR